MIFCLYYMHSMSLWTTYNDDLTQKTIIDSMDHPLFTFGKPSPVSLSKTTDEILGACTSDCPVGWYFIASVCDPPSSII